MITAQFDFDSALSFVLSQTQVAGGVAKLATHAVSKSFNQAFTSDVGFTYDSANVEFVGGILQQKDQRPVASLVGATYTSTKDLSWASGGTLAAIDVGTPVLSGGKLVCLGGGNNGVRYDGAPEVGTSAGNIGAVRFRYTPNYSGTPAANYNLIEFSPPSGNAGRMLILHSASGGTLRLTAYTSAGTVKHSAVVFGGAWSPVAGTEYELELNWDTIAGTVRLFVNGVLQGAMPVSSYDRGTAATRMHVGAGTVYPATDASFNDVLVFSAAQHTSNYTPGYSVVENVYATSKADLPLFNYTGPDSITSLSSLITTEVGNVRHVIGNRYWNGSSWVASNGSYAQANDKATVNANLAVYPLSDPQTSLQLAVVFSDTNSQENLDDLTMNYAGDFYFTSGNLETSSALQVQSLSIFASIINEALGAQLRFILNINSELKYWNGVAWVASNGSISQANTSADLNDNLDALSFGVNSSLKLMVVMSTSNDEVSPEIDQMTLVFDLGGVSQSLEFCTVWGYYKDIVGNPISGAKVKFSLKKPSNSYAEAANNIINGSVEVTTDANGYFEVDLVRSSEFEGTTPQKYVMNISKTSSNLLTSKVAGQNLEIVVPDAADVDVTTLLG